MIRRRNHPQPTASSAQRDPDKMSLRFVLPLVLFYVICGILLIWLDTVVITVASYTLAAFLGFYGIWQIVRYLRSAAPQRVAGTDLTVGLILLLMGVLIACNPAYLEGMFPVIWALSLIFGGFLKIQYAFDEKSVGVRRWWIMLAFAAFSLLIGTLAFLRTSIFGDNQNTIIGIMMLAEAVLDLTTYFLISKGMKKQAPAAAPAAPPAQAPGEAT